MTEGLGEGSPRVKVKERNVGADLGILERNPAGLKPETREVLGAQDLWQDMRIW